MCVDVVQFVSAVLAALVAFLLRAPISRAIKWAWSHMGRVMQVPSVVWAYLTRRRQKRLVDRVLEQAAQLKVEVPLAAKGTNPTRVNYHPTGRQELFYRDFASYKAGAERGEHHGLDARWGKVPTPVPRWGARNLMVWLKGHKRGARFEE